jgi:hypothetical protein
MTILFGGAIKTFTETQKAQIDELTRAIELFECDDIGGHFDIELLKALRDRLTIALNNDLQLLRIDQ